MRRHDQFFLTESLLQANFGCILVLRALETIVDELCFVPVGYLVFGRFAVEESFEFGLGGARMTLEETTDVDEEDAVVDEFPSGYGGSVDVHGGGWVALRWLVGSWLEMEMVLWRS